MDENRGKTDLTNRTVVVTGGAGDLGMAIVRAALTAGARVGVADSSNDALSRAGDSLREYAGALELLHVDVTDEASCTALAKSVVDRFGSVTDLVNNAGVIHRTSTESTTLAEWNEVIDVNLTGTFLATKAFIPELRRSGAATIVNVSSRAAVRPHRNASPAYGASKAAMVYLTRHWALELADAGIRVNAVLPGPTRTAMFEAMSVERKANAIASIPMGRPAEPDEIASAVLFLVSPESRYITGETINVNGGSHMG